MFDILNHKIITLFRRGFPSHFEILRTFKKLWKKNQSALPQMGTGVPDSAQVIYYYAVVREIPSFFKIFLFTLSTHTSIKCFQYPRPSSPRICPTPRHNDVNITWLIEPMKIKPSVNSSITDNRSKNCWPENRTVFC